MSWSTKRTLFSSVQVQVNKQPAQQNTASLFLDFKSYFCVCFMTETLGKGQLKCIVTSPGGFERL